LKAADREESLMSEQAKDSKSAGYKRPPRSGQFKKGQSGNPGGRPKRSGPIDIDFDQHLDELFDVKVNGRRQKMSAKEIELNRVLMKAMDKNKPDFKSIAYLLDLFEKYDCISRPVQSGGGVLEMPTNQYPLRMCMLIAERYGLPETWTKAQIAWGRKQYEATKTDRERLKESVGVFT
jgi:Family of unknown function (DUF5681)